MISKHNLRRVIHHAKAGNYHFIYHKLKQKLQEKRNRLVKKIDTKKEDVTESPDILKKEYFSRYFDSLHSKQDYTPFQENKLIKDDLRLIAFYLPQFHPIAENDEWWGKGFTEWTNVSSAIPQFEGHYQPHLPGELGFYDLRLNQVQKRQIELAKNYGIAGFCFHFYWFNGRRVLEKPVEQYLEDKSLDFPFCINWANENWTRRWDGHDSDVLLQQDYSNQDDIDFIQEASKYFNDDRYIRVDGKVLLMVYRPALFPDILATTERWRVWCRENGVGEIYLVLTHSFEHINPLDIGFDAAVEFAPNSFPMKPINDKVDFDNKNYRGTVFDYKDAIEISENFVQPKYKKFRSACPGWDNEARKSGAGTTLHNASPELFHKWLDHLCKYTKEVFKPQEQLVFINAWNEWAEGAHLEPDQKFGYGYLQASYDAFSNNRAGNKKIIFVSHDANFHGAQVLSLNIIKSLSQDFGLEVHLILKSGGELEETFKKYAKVYNLQKDYPSIEEQKSLVLKLKDGDISHAISNTVVSGDVVGVLSDSGIETIALIHELPTLIKDYGMEGNARVVSKKAKYVLFPSTYVRDEFETIASVAEDKSIVSPQGLYHKNKYMNIVDDARVSLRSQYKLPGESKIILGVGYGDYRKGIDIFLTVATLLEKERPDTYFMWVGNIDVSMQTEVDKLHKMCKNIVFISPQEDLSLFYAGADLYLMTSREDPFPSVVLESMNVGIPVIGFKNAGGFKDIVTRDTGVLVDYLNIEQMSEAVNKLLDDDKIRNELGKNSSELIHQNFNFKDYIYTLLDLVGLPYKKVSVIVPNYNYEKYIQNRLVSIVNQTYPIYEIIFLDDCSSDNSLEIAKGFLNNCGLDNITVVKNKVNSGSVFNQWSKGMALAKGDFVWIAEADDLAENELLAQVMKGFVDDEVVLSYCQSQQIDEKDLITEETYLSYTDDISREKWLQDYTRDGKEELSDTFVVKNTMPNVSAVVFKRTDISAVLDELLTFKVGGDWYFYFWLLSQGKISFTAKSLNKHRRHDNSVTISEKNNKIHFEEIVKMQEIIKMKLNVTDEIWEKSLKYRQQVKEYLNIS